MPKVEYERDPGDIRDLDQNRDALIKSMLPEDNVYTPDEVVDIFAEMAVYSGINVEVTDEESSNTLPRYEETFYNGEAEIIISGFGEDTKAYYRLDNNAREYFYNRFGTPPQ